MNEELALELLAEDKSAITYRPKIAKFVGSITGAILLQQIYYWFSRNDNKPFYKFRDECKHKLYKRGDSWCEELGFSHKQFDNALDVIGIKIETGVDKSAVMAHDFEGDEFPFASLRYLVVYWTDSNRITWYWLNRKLLGKCLKWIYLYKSQNGTYLKRPKRKLPFLTDTTTITTSEITSETTHTAPSGARFVSDDLSHDVKVSVEREEPKKTTAIKEKTPTKANAAKDENPLPVPQGFPQTGKRGKRGKPTKAELAAQRVAGLTDAERAIYDVLSGQFGYQPEFDEDFETDMARVAKFNPTPESVKRYIERRKNSQWWRDNKGSAAVSLKVVADNLSEIATPSKQSNTSKPQGYRESFIIK